MSERTVAVRLRARVDAYQADLRKAANETKAFSAKATSGFKSVTKSVADLGPTARVSAGVALAAMGAFALKSISAASDLNETVSKTGVLFGQSASKIEAWASTASTSIGQSKKQAMDAAASFAVFGKSAGLSGDALVEFSKQNVQLASDMASFFNTSPEDAINAIGSAFRGEAEPIRAYGILLDDATLRQSALEMGLISTTKNALTPQQKVLAAQAVIMKQTTDAQGDFARTSDGLANSQRILAAQFEDTQAQLGQALLPVALKATQVFGTLLRTVNGLPEPIKLTGIGAAAAVAGFILLAPRIVATVDAMKALSASSPGAAAGLARLGTAAKIGGAVTALAAVVYGLGEAVAFAEDKLGMGAQSVEQWNSALAGNVGGEDLLRVKEALTGINGQGGLSAVFSAAVRGDAIGAVAAIRGASNEVERFDQAMASLVASGGAQKAAAVVQALGLSADEVSEKLPQYAAAIGASGAAASEAVPKTDDLSFAQQVLKDKADATKQAIAALSSITKEWMGLADRDEAATAMADGFDTLAAAVKKNGGTLAGTSAAARDAQAAFRGSMDDIAAYAETFKDPKKKADALRDGLDTVKGRLKAMGLSPGEIARLTKPYEDLAAKAKAAAEQQARIERNIDITVTYTQRGYAPAPNGGGRVAYDGKPTATGGYITGPGTGTSDSIPLRVSNGEYVVRAASVDKYGVDFLDAVNRGALPGYASGGKVSKRAARRTAAIEKVTSLRSDKASAIASTAASMSSAFGLMGAFDFGAQARAIDDLASAQERLASASQSVADADGAVFDARRAVNSAGTPKERAEAEKKLAEALERQTKARAERASAEGGVASAKVAVKKAAATPGNILAAWQGRLRALVNFRKNLDTLRKKGFGPNIIAQIAGEPDGAEIAAALVKSTPSQVKAFNATDAALTKVSGAVGRIAGSAQYDPQIRSAQQAAMGLGATAKQVGPLVPAFGTAKVVIHSHVHVGKRQIAESKVDLSRRDGGYDWGDG